MVHTYICWICLIMFSITLSGALSEANVSLYYDKWMTEHYRVLLLSY